MTSNGWFEDLNVQICTQPSWSQLRWHDWLWYCTQAVYPAAPMHRGVLLTWYWTSEQHFHHHNEPTVFTRVWGWSLILFKGHDSFSRFFQFCFGIFELHLCQNTVLKCTWIPEETSCLLVYILIPLQETTLGLKPAESKSKSKATRQVQIWTLEVVQDNGKEKKKHVRSVQYRHNKIKIWKPSLA